MVLPQRCGAGSGTPRAIPVRFADSVDGAIKRMLVMVMLIWIEVMSLRLLSRAEAGAPIRE